MNAVQIFIFALCIYQISAGEYEDALVACRAESNIPNDKPIDHFFLHGAWPEGTTTANCYFRCLGTKLKIIDENNIPIPSKLAKLAGEHPDERELKLLADNAIFTACSTQPKGLDDCATTQNYVVCAVNTYNAQKQS